MYIYTYIYSQKLSAQISWGFKMLVKLGVRMQKFIFFHFKIFQTVYPYMLKYINKSCPYKFRVGLNFGQVGGRYKQESKTHSRVDFFEISLKVYFLKKKYRGFPF